MSLDCDLVLYCSVADGVVRQCRRRTGASQKVSLHYGPVRSGPSKGVALCKSQGVSLNRHTLKVTRDPGQPLLDMTGRPSTAALARIARKCCNYPRRR